MAGLTYGARLRRLRIRNAMNQKELADKIGVTQATISNWERGNGEPSADQKKGLKKILGVGGARRQDDSANDQPDLGGTSIGAWLNKARVGSGMSVSELAAAAKLSPQAIYNIESGRISNPRENTVQKLEKALNSQLPEETKAEIKEEATIEGFGQLEDFDPHNKSERPNCPGIYVFYDISERPIYVGQSSNIKKRIATHEDRFWFKSPIVHMAAYVQVPDDPLRSQVEKLLIRFLKSNAVINKQNVDR